MSEDPELTRIKPVANLRNWIPGAETAGVLLIGFALGWSWSIDLRNPLATVWGLPLMLAILMLGTWLKFWKNRKTSELD